MGFPGSSAEKESACHAGDLGSIPELGIPWRRAWQPTPVVHNGASQVVLVLKNPSVNAGDIRDVSLIPGSGRSSGGG